jgi:uridine kinase
MNHYFIGIAGGSGCGKSTLSYRLRKEFPDLIETVHFDDYQKEERDVPLFKGMKNWDHPEAIDFEKLYQDLRQLQSNQQVKVMTKNSIINPSYEQEGRIQHILEPKKIIIVEGYMVFQNEKVRDLLDFKIFLDISIEKSVQRRNKITYNDEEAYNDKILVPMHKKYVEPSKAIADLSIDVLKNDKEQVYQIIVDTLVEMKLLSSSGTG